MMKVHILKDLLVTPWGYLDFQKTSFSSNIRYLFYPALWTMCHIHGHISGRQTQKAHLGHTFLFAATASDPLTSLALFSLPFPFPGLTSNCSNGSGQPLAVGAHCWAWWQNPASLHLTFGVPLDAPACVHIRHPLSSLGSCTFKPNLVWAQTWLVLGLDPPELPMTVLILSAHWKHLSCVKRTQPSPHW